MKTLKNIVTVFALAIFLLNNTYTMAQTSYYNEKPYLSSDVYKTNFYYEDGNNNIEITNNLNLNDKRVLLGCVTTSCCSFFFFTVEVWSQTTCYYADAQQKNGKKYHYSIKINPKKNKKINEIEVTEEVILNGFVSDKGELLYLPKGKYKVYNNEFFFTPIKKAKTKRMVKLCIDKEVDGTILGHHYHYAVHWCISISVSVSKKVNGKKFANMAIKLNLPTKELENQLNKKGGDYFKLDKDITFDKEGIKYTLKKGNYFVNKNSTIYIYDFVK